jgi:hypothetical protein
MHFASAKAMHILLPTAAYLLRTEDDSHTPVLAPDCHASVRFPSISSSAFFRSIPQRYPPIPPSSRTTR